MSPKSPDKAEEAGLRKRTWYVFRVKPNTEKKISKWFAFYKFLYHLPLYEKITKVQRRKVRRYLPLFPGYVFTKLYPEERLTMLKTNLITSTIYVPNPRRMIHQLRQIKNATRKRREMKVVEKVFKQGDKVRITGGPMYGLEGYVKREGPNATLCLNVDILGATAEVAVPPEDLAFAEKVD